MRWLAAVCALGLLLNCCGCVAVAVVSVASAIAVTTVKTTGKVAVATVATTGKVASAAVSSSGSVTALSIESAAKLARAGMVVAVDAGTGAIVQLPWRDGMQLYAATQSPGLGGNFKAAKIFRAGRAVTADLRKNGAAAIALHPRDVVELRR